MARPASPPAQQRVARRPTTGRPGATRAPSRRVATRRITRRHVGATGGGTLALIICVVLVVTVLPLCLLAVVGLAPAVAAAVFDRHPRRHLLRAVAACNLAGMVQPVGTLLHAGLTVYGAAQVLFDPYQWLWMYGASGLGWLAYLAMPPLMHYVIEGRAARTEKELQERAKALVEEWGEEVDTRKSVLAAVAAAAPVSPAKAGAPSPSP